MGFSFASTTPAPAPPAFGATPAPAAPPAFGAAPAPATGGFGFGGTPAPAAPAAPAFGAKPTPVVPALGGFGFGGTPAPAAPVSGFGAAPTPGGFGFGGTPTPAPSGGLFGPAPAPAPFGALQPVAGGVPAQPPAALAGHVPYAALPPDQKRAIDTLQQAIMQHKRTILQVSTMAPRLLSSATSSSNNNSPADAAAGPNVEPNLKTQLHKLATQVQQLQQSLHGIRQHLEYTYSQYQTSTKRAVMFAKWPTEAVAARRGVPLKQSAADQKKDPALQQKLRELLDREMTHVDRVERMPSPYLWQTLDEMEHRLQSIQVQMNSFQQSLQETKKLVNEDIDITSILKLQEQSIWKVASALAPLHNQVDRIRQSYRLAEKENNVLELADQTERERQQQLDHQMRLQMVKTLPARTAVAAPVPGGGIFGAAPVPGGGIFGAPAPGSSLFGTTPAPAPGGLFSSTPAPAPGGFGFGTPAPAPSGGLFGPAPAPAAPVSAGGLFGNTPAPAPGGLFGSTPAPAPGGLFNSKPAPAPAFGSFGSTTLSSSSTPKSKNKGRSTRRR